MAQWLAQKGKAPQTQVAEPDDLYPDLIPVWNAWHELHTSRPIGMTAGGVPWSEQSRWCEDNGVHGERRRRWVRLLRAMDCAYLRHTAEAKGAARGNP